MSGIYELPRQCGKTINIEDLYKKMEDLYREQLEGPKEQKFDPYISSQQFGIFNFNLFLLDITLEQFVQLWLNKREYLYDTKIPNIIKMKNNRIYTIGNNISKKFLLRESNWRGETEHPK